MLKEKVKSWQHIFKLDPAKNIPKKDLDKIKQSNTDALIVGGTDNIEAEDVIDLLLELSDTSIPIILEISVIEAIVPGFDYYFIPVVLNSQDKKWIMNIHLEAIKECSKYIELSKFLVE